MATALDNLTANTTLSVNGVTYNLDSPSANEKILLAVALAALAYARGLAPSAGQTIGVDVGISTGDRVRLELTPGNET